MEAIKAYVKDKMVVCRKYNVVVDDAKENVEN